VIFCRSAAHGARCCLTTIANNLAKLALQNIPLSRIKEALVENASERLLRSFSRRLGYLDGNKEAKAIVESWLAPDGLLSDVTSLDELGQAIFNNIAPVVPDAVLSALEHALSGADEEKLRRCKHFVRLLRSLAYETIYFERAVALLIKFARLPGESDPPATMRRVSLPRSSRSSCPARMLRWTHGSGSWPASYIITMQPRARSALRRSKRC
jgi:hypothetical protein